MCADQYPALFSRARFASAPFARISESGNRRRCAAHVCWVRRCAGWVAGLVSIVMPLFQHRPASPNELPAAIGFLPVTQFDCSREVALLHWQRWHQEGAISVGLVEAIEGDRAPVIAGAGVTLWISDEAVAELHQPHPEAGSVRLYDAESAGARWVLNRRQIAAAHSQCNLNLWIVHFWPDPDPANPDFAAFFVQSVASFRELHDGFGVRRLFQEIAAHHVPIMEAAGMRIARPPDTASPRALAMLARDDARAEPGSLLSFLFLTPPGRLRLRASEQRMLLLALRQLTDSDVAERMDCSREYIRKLWSRVYDALHAHAALAHVVESVGLKNHRGREKRRLALEFFRAHPEELRPIRLP